MPAEASAAPSPYAELGDLDEHELAVLREVGARWALATGDRARSTA